MKRITLILLVIVSIIGRTDEGMYLPFMLKNNYKDMKASGLEISYTEIYNPKKPSIKDAIVSLGGFCTAEIISPKGLMLTNHHCGYDAIRENSTPENDYLTDGFWAMDLKEELPIDGLTASIVVNIIDVTKQINSKLTDGMDADQRAFVIKRVSEELSQKETAGTHYSAYVKEFYEGSEFYLFVVEVFNDIRLVGAPPSAVGKYGGNTDNWMWTRHTGDFSMFRIYAGVDNRPAEFSMMNQPYIPKHHLPISIEGVEEGDFSMVMGYPGSTDRYLSSYGVEMAIEQDQPARVKIRGKKLELMKTEMDKSDAVRLQYASSYAQVSNYWKYYIGQTEQLKKNDVFNEKRQIENEFINWVSANKKRVLKYGNVMENIQESYETIKQINPIEVYFIEAFYFVNMNRFMLKHKKLYMLLTADKLKQNLIDEEAQSVQKNADDYFKSFNYEIESRTLAAMAEMYMNDVPADQHTEELDTFGEKADKNWISYVDGILSKSVFTDADRYEEFITNPTKSMLEDDPVFLLNISLLNKYIELVYSKEATKAHNKLNEANRLFIAGLREMSPKKKFYPNANFSLRLTYGNILKYSAQGKDYDYFTTIEGLMAKEDSNNPDFIVPDKLKELYANKDYGRYGKDNNLWINFISNNDITGGNSGSPVMNSKGHLIGCAFDGNWEAMSGDISFEEDFQRTISCDIRYILFIIDKYANANHLIDEMTIIE